MVSFEREFVFVVFDFYLQLPDCVSCLWRSLRQSVCISQSKVALQVDVLVVFCQRSPKRMFNTTSEVVEALVGIFFLKILYVLYALQQCFASHVFLQVFWVKSVSRISKQMCCNQPEVFTCFGCWRILLLALSKLFC